MSRCSLAGTLAIVGAPVDVATSASAAAAKAVSFSCISALYPPRTAGQNSVDVSQGRVESRLVVPAVVVDPTPDVAVKHPGQVVQRLVAALVKCPASDRLSDHLESLVACRRAEQDAKGTPPASRQPRPEQSPKAARLGRCDRDIRHHHALQKELPFLGGESRFVCHRRCSSTYCAFAAAASPVFSRRRDELSQRGDDGNVAFFGHLLKAGGSSDDDAECLGYPLFFSDTADGYHFTP